METVKILTDKLRDTLKRMYHYANNRNRGIQKENTTCIISNCCTLHDVEIGKYVKVYDGCWLSTVQIGDFSYISFNSTLVNVSIGKFCSIANNVKIGLASHPSKVFVSTHPVFYSQNNPSCVISFRNDTIFDESEKKTIIGHDVWIGSDVIIPGGITIGSGAIVAAGSVVVKDVPPYAIVGGNPAQIIRYRFSEEQISNLLKIKWWDWPIDDFKDSVDYFDDISSFIKSFNNIR